MKKSLLIGLLMIAGASLKAQKVTQKMTHKVDSICFHLYTDSLKKGTHNYINVDGKLSNGQWLPMTSKDLNFTSSSCQFSGNELVIPPDFSDEKITVKAELKSNPGLWVERTIWIKKLPDPTSLPSQDDILRGMKNNKGKRRG